MLSTAAGPEVGTEEGTAAEIVLTLGQLEQVTIYNIYNIYNIYIFIITIPIYIYTGLPGRLVPTPPHPWPHPDPCMEPK